MTKEPIHIAMASNRRYLPGLRATTVSLVRAAAERESLRFHIFSDGLTKEYEDGLKFAREKDAFAFAFDSLKGLIAKPKDIDSFGIHGHSTVDMLRRGIENTTVG